MRIYAKGLNFMGQLGLGHYINQDKFTRVPAFDNLQNKWIGAHLTQSYALLSDNQLLHWGWLMDSVTQNRVLSFYKKSPFLCGLWQDYSFLGDTVGMRGGIKSPLLLNKSTLDFKIRQVSAGSSYLMCLHDDGQVYGVGENYKGQLGTGDIKFKPSLTKVALPTKEQIVRVSTGSQHSLLLTKAGKVYGTGRSNHYQYQSVKKDIYVDFNENLQMLDIDDVSEMSCGFNHSLFLSIDRRSLYSCGLNVYGQCGVTNFDDGKVKKITRVYIELDNDETIVQISSGQAHNLILTSTGRVLFFGATSHNQLGYSSKFDFEQSGPTEVQLPLKEGEKVISVKAAFDLSAAITSTGDCFVWGGLNMSYYGIPYYEGYTRLSTQIAEQGKIKDIALGYSHTLVLME